MNGKAKVAMASNFLDAFSKLDRKVQGKVSEFVNKFMNNPTSPGINYEKVKNASDNKICSVRIDDTYRGIVVRQPETGVYLLLWVAKHDDAYKWATSKRCDVNPENGAIQVYDIQTSVEKNVINEDDILDTNNYLFAHLTDEDLLKLSLIHI